MRNTAPWSGLEEDGPEGRPPDGPADSERVLLIGFPFFLVFAYGAILGLAHALH